ncbi:crotonase/enoyl-CoA hydratase family protein [Myxococcota bacterium]|nr:crotonase/enoyl-CoA hydratase family protein [Myxococcota bacterium]
MTVVVNQRGPVLIITLGRPEKRNAIDPDTAAGIDHALNELEDTEELLVGVITGGPSLFSAGSDLKLGSGEPTERGGEYGMIRRTAPKPIIAAVEGLAYGGGMEIVLACDLVVASRSARFGLPEIKRGLIAAYGGVFRAPKALPLNIAKELVLTGDPISAERAAQFGLVNQLCQDGEALEAALELAERVAINAPVSVRESLRVLDESAAESEQVGWALMNQAVQTVFESEDAREGREAFLEKREPRWRGR